MGCHPGCDATGEGHKGQVNGGTPRDGPGITAVNSAKRARKGLPGIGDVDVS